MAIIAAAVRQLGEQGYPGMSLERVAAVAGTTAPTLRRRYRDKLELALAAVDAMRIEPPTETAADARADALAVLENLRANLLGCNGIATLGTIMAEDRRHPELLEHFVQRLVEPQRERLRLALARGVQAGRLPAALDVDTAVDMLIGSLGASCLRTRRLSGQWAEKTLAVIWPRPRREPRPASRPGPGG